MSEESKGKVQAIYELREATEQKVRAEIALDFGGDAESRDALLDARLNLESKTQDAIDVCHECDRPHASDAPHERLARVVEHHGNVLNVDFRPIEERERGGEKA